MSPFKEAFGHSRATQTILRFCAEISPQGSHEFIVSCFDMSTHVILIMQMRTLTGICVDVCIYIYIVHDMYTYNYGARTNYTY